MAAKALESGRRAAPGRVVMVCLPLALAACGDPSPAAPDGATAVDAAAEAAAPAPSRGSCVYTNPFSMGDECKDYIDASWTSASMAADCMGSRGTLREGTACSFAAMLGTCEVRATAGMTRISFPGSSASSCAITRTGCTVFARGNFTAMGVCASGDGGVSPAQDASATPPPGVFQPPVRECRPPREGERPGAGPNGQVCTWSAISAATEEGRRYQDYASCDRVRTQRPYYPVDAAPPRGNDARMRDPAYVAELAWVRGQVQSSACVCCHSTAAAPRGTSQWYIEAPGNWMDSFFDSGLALGAGWIDSSSFGAYPAADNNGFSRTTSGFPSTDPERMARFFRNELAHRGRTRESFSGARPFGGPIYNQLVYTPSACTGTDGVAADGTLRWSGGPARYVYVLNEGTANPGVPPNLDLPMGTRWRVDVPPTGSPIESGIAYGRVPMGASQRFPAMGAPQPLAPGARYYLYVLADVGIPLTRCVFTTPR